MSYTYVILEISPEAFNEIKGKLEKAGYEHAFEDDGDGLVIDMHGLAVKAEKA